MKVNHLAVLGLSFVVLLSACKKDDDEGAGNCTVEIPAGTRFFEFQHDDEDSYYAWTNKQEVINQVEAQLSLPFNERNQHINGKIARIEGDCQLNNDWSWYFTADDWVMADLSIELCDGNPNYVEENLDEYIRIGGYCPWGAKVLREVTQPF